MKITRYNIFFLRRGSKFFSLGTDSKITRFTRKSLGFNRKSIESTRNSIEFIDKSLEFTIKPVESNRN